MKKLIIGFAVCISLAGLLFSSPARAACTGTWLKDNSSTLTTNLISYWKASNNATDECGLNNGTSTGPRFPSYVTGIIGNAFNTTSSGAGGAGLNAGSSSILIASSTSLKALSRSFSVGFTFRSPDLTTPSAGSNPTFVGFGTNGAGIGYSVTGAKLHLFKVGAAIVDTGIGISANTTTTVVFTMSSTGTFAFYINDGTSTAETANTATTFSGTTNPEFTRDDSSPNVEAYIDEIGVWSKELSKVEINDLYNNGVGNTFTQTPINPSIQLSTSTYSFSATNASGTELITNSGAVGANNLNWTITSTQPWLTFSTSSGVLAQGATGTTNFISNLWGYAAGTYNATASISDSNSTNSPQTASVTAVVNSAGGGGGGTSLSCWFFN